MSKAQTAQNDSITAKDRKINKFEEKWLNRYHALVSFYREHGHSCVPQNNPSIGQWVKVQRENYFKNRMRPDRLQKLNQVEFVWDAKEEAWDDKFQLLVEFQNTHKHTIVPQSHGRLGVWVRNQRSLYKAYLREDPNCQLTPERVQKLNSLEFSWDANEAKWSRKYDLLKLLAWWQSHNRRTIF